MLSLKIKDLVNQMKDTNWEIRFNAIKTLYNLELKTLTPDELIFIAKEAGSTFPEPVDKWDNPSYMLIGFLSRYSSPLFSEVFTNNFKNYDILAKELALDMLLRVKTRKSVETSIKLLIDNSKTENIRFNFSFFTDNLTYSDLLFPQFYELLDNPFYEKSVLFLMLLYLKLNKIEPINKEINIKRMLNLYKEEKEEYITYDKVYSTHYVYKFWNEQYFTVRSNMLSYIYLMKYFCNEEVIEELNKILEFKDKILKSNAIAVLVQLGVQVENEHFIDCINDIEGIISLYRVLDEIGNLELFPKEYLKQELFVKSDMTLWLLNNKEYNLIPDEIEVLNPISIKNEKKENVLFYPCKFISSDEKWKEKGWLLGISGAYSVYKLPSPYTQSRTVSFFDQLKETSVMNYMMDMVNLLGYHYYNLSEQVLSYSCPKINYKLPYLIAFFFLLGITGGKTHNIVIQIFSLISCLYFLAKNMNINKKKKEVSFFIKNSFIEYWYNSECKKIETKNISKLSVENRKIRKYEKWAFLNIFTKRTNYVVLYDINNEELLSIPISFIDIEILKKHLIKLGVKC